MIKIAKIEFTTGKVENIFISESEDLPEEFGNPIHYVTVDDAVKIGDIYNRETETFTDPQPFPSWTYNNESGKWEPPVSMPDDYNAETNSYKWDEENQTWSN